MTSRALLLLLIAGSCRSTPAGDAPHPIPSIPIETSGPLARRFFGAPGFRWTSFQSKHARIHLAPEMDARRIVQLADSFEQGRAAALALLDEGDIADEPLLELFLVETREDMQRFVGRPVGGSAFPGELTVVFVAGAGFRPFWRHELTHAFAARRWGRRQSGSWLDEGPAAVATGPCQGHSIDSLAAGYLKSGEAPTFEQFNGAFYQLPDLPSYLTAASFVDHLLKREGIAALRSIWRGERPGADRSLPLGADTIRAWNEWRDRLATVPPATLDTERLRREGC